MRSSRESSAVGIPVLQGREDVNVSSLLRGGVIGRPLSAKDSRPCAARGLRLRPLVRDLAQDYREACGLLSLLVLATRLSARPRSLA